MEVFLAVATATMGIALLAMAATSRARVEKHADPLIKSAARDLTGLINRNAQEVHYRLDDIHSKTIRTGKESQESVRSTQRLTRTAQTLEASLSAAKAEASQSSQRILEMRQSIEQLQADQAMAQKVITVTSRDIAQLQASILQLTESRDADKQEVSELLRRISDAKDSINRIAGRLATVASSLNELEAKAQVGERRLIHTVRNTNMLNVGMGQLNLYVLHWLDLELSFPNENGRPHIVGGGLSSDPSTAQIMWTRCEALWEALSARLLFRYPPGSPITSFYLLWDSRTRGSLPEYMGALFENCRTQAPTTTADGLRQLQSLLLVMYNGRPATWLMGPALVTRTKDEMLAGILPEDHSTGTRDQISLPPSTWAAKLHELNQDRVVDLTAWADSYAV